MSAVRLAGESAGGDEKKYADAHIIPRLGKTDDITAAVEALPVDGGWNAKGNEI